MKKILTALLLAVLCFSAVSCSGVGLGRRGARAEQRQNRNFSDGKTAIMCRSFQMCASKPQTSFFRNDGGGKKAAEVLNSLRISGR